MRPGEREPGGSQEGAAALARRLGLGEELGVGGTPRLTLTSALRGPVETIGSLRRFVGHARGGAPAPSLGGSAPEERGALGGRDARGDRARRQGVDDRGDLSEPGLLELLELRLGVPLLGLAMERVIGFAGRESAAPHLLFSAVTTGAPGAPAVATITADLLPRRDLMLDPTYADRVYGPLAAELEEFARGSEDACDGVELALEGPVARRLVASPWASRVSAVAGPPTLRSGLFRVYAARWIELVSGGEDALAGSRDPWAPEPASRYRRLRAVLSEARSDPLWRELARLCGPEQAAAVGALVRGDG